MEASVASTEPWISARVSYVATEARLKHLSREVAKSVALDGYQGAVAGLELARLELLARAGMPAWQARATT